MIKPKDDTKNSLSISENSESLVEQTHRKPEETLDFKLTKPRETFHSQSPISNEGSWMIGLTSIEAYNSIFTKNATNKKIELYTDTFDQFSLTELKDELEEILDSSNITSEHLQDDIIGPRINSSY